MKRRPGRSSHRSSALRVPIAFKFTAFIAVLIVAAMTWQAYTASEVANRELEREITRSGVVLATALTTLIDPAWLKDLSHQNDLKAVLNRFIESRGSARVLNVVAYDSSGAAVATARGESQFSASAGEPFSDEFAGSAGVEIREFTYEQTLSRKFSRDILDAGGAGAVKAGRVEVFLSAQAIEESRAQLSGAMIKVAAAACLAAAVGAFLLARFLTRPIRALFLDMKQVSLGDLDHQARVSSSDELGDLAHAFNVMTAGLKAAQEAKLERRALEHELSVATRIQMRLLPEALPAIKGFDIASHYAPAREVGGDYYDFIKIDPDHLGVAVADVSGKGIPASLIMTMTRVLLRAAARGETSPAKTVDLVNKFLTPDMDAGMFVTLAYLVIDFKARDARLVRAGHNPPFLYSARHGRVLRLQPRGMAVGLDRDGSLFQSEMQVQRFQVHSGDVLLLYSDGVVEGKSSSGKDYSDDRLEAALAAHASASAAEIVSSVMRDLTEHERGAEQSDDITLIAIKGL